MDSVGSLPWSQTWAPVPLQKKVLGVEQSDWNRLLEVTGMFALLQLRPRNSRRPSRGLS